MVNIGLCEFTLILPHHFTIHIQFVKFHFNVLCKYDEEDKQKTNSIKWFNSHMVRIFWLTFVHFLHKHEEIFVSSCASNDCAHAANFQFAVQCTL